MRWSAIVVVQQSIPPALPVRRAEDAIVSLASEFRRSLKLIEEMTNKNSRSRWRPFQVSNKHQHFFLHFSELKLCCSSSKPDDDGSWTRIGKRRVYRRWTRKSWNYRGAPRWHHCRQQLFHREHLREEGLQTRYRFPNEMGESSPGCPSSASAQPSSGLQTAPQVLEHLDDVLEPVHVVAKYQPIAEISVRRWRRHCSILARHGVASYVRTGRHAALDQGYLELTKNLQQRRTKHTFDQQSFNYSFYAQN